MRAVGTTLLLTTVVLLAAGCGSGSDPTPPPSSSAEAPPTVATGAPPGGTSTPPVPVDPLVADPPAGATALDPARVTATVPAGFPTLVWSRGPRTLGVYGRAGGCTEASAAVVGETAEEVSVRVTQTTTSSGPCTRELRYPPLEVPLAADLDQRRVVLTGEQRQQG